MSPRPNATHRGQGLLEAIVAMGILSTAIAASLTLATTALRAEGDAADMVVAGNLAREGIEVVRGLRDQNWNSGGVWDGGLSSDTDYTGTAVFDPATGLWSLDFEPNLVTDEDARIYRRVTASGGAVSGIFQQAASQPSGTVPSGFYRLLSLNPICRDVGGYTVITSGSCATEKVGVQVLSRVRWSRGGRTHELLAEERMYNWR